MLLQDVSMLDETTIASAFILLIGVFTYSVARYRQQRAYRPYPKTAAEQAKAANDDRHRDDEDDEITEIINTLDYHQVPKQLIAEKARRLARGQILPS